MKQRHYFYLILAFIGELSVLGQWALFRHSLPVPEMPLLALFMVLPILYVIPYVFSESLPPMVTRGLTRFAGYWFSFSYYATMLLIPGLLLWIVTQLMGRNDLWQGTVSVYYSAFAFGLTWLLLAVGAWIGHHQVVRTVDIETDKAIDRDFSIAFVSDIHLGAVLGTSFSRQLTQDVNACRPDMVLMGGDIIDGDLQYVLREDSFSGFEGLKAPAGVFAVMGNHDTYGENLALEAEVLGRHGVRVLNGDVVTPIPGVTLFGREDYYIAPAAPVRKADEAAFSIFMEHEPMHIHQAAEAGWDLHVSGHTHAGQFWPNRLVTSRLFALDYGSRTFGKMTAMVSSGYGAWSALFRIGPPPEVVLIRVHKKGLQKENILGK
ncbi:metallophosphoesterase [uncultured Megasphaera sp.]|uniref:metallophosphoesterase n=1 Tax=uncultured Megasphaera sp. TaxID=165188 RepID=UPI002634306A|nr:metallophosphoesterase [uncultured Megasphaera sp.]